MLLGAYVDNEIDLMTSLALGEHVATCAACTYELDAHRSVKRLVHEADLTFPCPPELRQRILRDLTPRGIRRRTVFGFGVRHWLGFGATVMLVSFLGIYLLSIRPIERMTVDEVVNNHIRSMLANHLTDIASSDQHTVKPWFNGKLNFSPEVADFSDKGYPLIGGRLDYMNNNTVAVTIYKRRQHIINVFSYPTTTHLDPVVSETRGYSLIHWSYHGLECWVVSDLNRDELQSFVDLLRD
jgi:anti-sigma factor RsiW